MVSEGREIIETVTLADCKENVEDDNSIADMPTVPSHSKAYCIAGNIGGN